MADNRQDITTHAAIDGEPYLITLIENPTIDDVVITEAKIQASAIENRDGSADNRRVDRGIRDFLIRLGVFQ